MNEYFEQSAVIMSFCPQLYTRALLLYVHFTEPDSRPNGLRCLSCKKLTETTCNSSISCMGNQDHCMTGTGQVYMVDFSTTEDAVYASILK